MISLLTFGSKQKHQRMTRMKMERILHNLPVILMMRQIRHPMTILILHQKKRMIKRIMMMIIRLMVRIIGWGGVGEKGKG